MKSSNKSEAISFIEAIASNMVEVYKPLSEIRDVLENDEALADMGATDESQGLIEEAHNLVEAWIDAGYETLDQAPR